LLDEGRQRGVEPVGVDVLHEPADRRLARAPLRGTQVLGHRGGQVGDPFGDRHERACPGGDGAHRRGQHHDQAVAHPARLARIGDLPQHRPQLGRDGDRIGQFRPTQMVDEARVDKDAGAGTALFR
jgi:hypothetical protein